MGPMRRLWIPAAAPVVAAAAVLVAPAQAAAPNYILVSGRGLSHPVLLADWQENMKLLLAVANAPRARGQLLAGLSSRPRFDLAEFWGWSGRPRPTRPSQASQHGTFYPAHGSKVALIVLTVQGVTVPRRVPSFVLRTLARHDIPTRR
jgi:hypothetical protein